MTSNSRYLKGRGAQINPPSRFEKYLYDADPFSYLLEEEDAQMRTKIIPVHPKTILNKVDSPDIPFPYSMNPYQGCEHGCIYCYARNTHPYWGYSAGLEFEQKILVKQGAAELLEEKMKSPRWKAAPIMLSGNTDCYQPVERKLKVTRSLLDVLWRYRHPVGIITKNSLILRDLDLLQQLSEHNLVRVCISLTTLDDHLRQFMEPRTASVRARLKTIKILSDHGIPVTVMMAPVIPGLTDHEIFDLLQAAAEAGAESASYGIVRLNGDVASIFEDWIRKNYPDRSDKIIHKIQDCHGGSTEDHRFGTRMKGEGHIARIIGQQFRLAKKKFFPSNNRPPLDTTLHQSFKTPQLSLF
ncbi:MAG: PA0069 family radical SAM protein [Bacteroidota bacterium]